MIDKKISVSEQVANLTYKAQLLFTWSIPHSDDVGLLPGSLKTLKALLVPMWEIQFDEFTKLVGEILEQKLWKPFEYDGQTYFYITKFADHQILKKDRQPHTILNIELSEKTKDSWKLLEDIGFQMEDTDFHLEPEGKGREGKGSKREHIAMPKSLLNRITKLPANPQVTRLMGFFNQAVRIIRRIEPPEMNKGKVGAIVKKRLEQDNISAERIECMTLWYLTREKRFQDNRKEWQRGFKNSPDMAVMLSDAYFAQLLSDEANIIIYMRDNSDWIDKVYINFNALPTRQKLKVGGMEKLGDILQNKLKK